MHLAAKARKLFSSATYTRPTCDFRTYLTKCNKKCALVNLLLNNGHCRLDREGIRNGRKIRNLPVSQGLPFVLVS